jgi:hypothetical protein
LCLGFGEGGGAVADAVGGFGIGGDFPAGGGDFDGLAAVVLEIERDDVVGFLREAQGYVFGGALEGFGFDGVESHAEVVDARRAVVDLAELVD